MDGTLERKHLELAQSILGRKCIVGFTDNLRDSVSANIVRSVLGRFCIFNFQMVLLSNFEDRKIFKVFRLGWGYPKKQT